MFGLWPPFHHLLGIFCRQDGRMKGFAMDKNAKSLAAVAAVILIALLGWMYVSSGPKGPVTTTTQEVAPTPAPAPEPAPAPTPAPEPAPAPAPAPAN
jgi:hypothetical protein